jgi:hypothetical protein
VLGDHGVHGAHEAVQVLARRHAVAARGVHQPEAHRRRRPAKQASCHQAGEMQSSCGAQRTSRRLSSPRSGRRTRACGCCRGAAASARPPPETLLAPGAPRASWSARAPSPAQRDSGAASGDAQAAHAARVALTHESAVLSVSRRASTASRCMRMTRGKSVGTLAERMHSISVPPSYSCARCARVRQREAWSLCACMAM